MVYYAQSLDWNDDNVIILETDGKRNLLLPVDSAKKY